MGVTLGWWGAQGTELPASMTLGPASLEASMQGTGMAPEIKALWQVPAAQATGSALLNIDSTKITCNAPLSGPVGHHACQATPHGGLEERQDPGTACPAE